MIPNPKCSVLFSLVHVGQLGTHSLVWEHAHVLDIKRLEHMFLEIIVQRQTAGAFNS